LRCPCRLYQSTAPSSPSSTSASPSPTPGAPSTATPPSTPPAEVRSLLIVGDTANAKSLVDEGGRLLSQTSEEDESTEDDESDDDLDEETTTFCGGGASGSFVSFADEGFGARIRRIESDIYGHQGFVRRGVEGLARSAGGKEVREVYGLLAVRLGDWV
jgi:hypothetical protein